MSVATAEVVPPVGEDIRSLFYKLGDAFSETYAHIDARFDRLDERVDRLEARMDARFDQMDLRFEQLIGRVGGRFDQLVGLIERDEFKR